MIEQLDRALSVRQPHCERILRSDKTCEYRSRQCHIRGRVYLYASKAIDTDIAEWTDEASLALPRGLIVGSIEIIGCVDEARGGYAWLLGEPRRYRKPWRPLGQPQPGFWRPKQAK